MNIKLMLSRHLLIFLALGVVKVDGIKCYICGENEESGTPCQNFETEKDNYAKECDPTDKGCKTETLGNNIVKRTCILNPFNQCITANHVVYCFCSTNLCNGNSSSIKFPTDDEDLLEGSGVKTESIITEKHNVTVKIISSGANILCVSSFIFFIVIYSIYSY